MEQAQRARDPEPGEARDRAAPGGAEAVLAPDRGGVAYAPNAVKKQRIKWERHVMS